MRPASSLLIIAWSLLITASSHAEEAVIPLKVFSGNITAHGDGRIFSVPVKCNGQDADWIWGCGGDVVITQRFADLHNLKATAIMDGEDVLDVEGKPIYVGETRLIVNFGSLAHRVVAKVMRDTAYNRTINGIIGYDIAIRFQWELNPDPLKPTLTLRPPGTKLGRKSLAVLPLKDDRDNLWINVKIRNVPADVLLMPQSSDIQIDPELQRKWDIESGLAHEEAGYLGTQRTRKLTGGKDSIELAGTLREAGLVVILVGDKAHPELTPAARSGLGQSLLNRFVYCVDAKSGEFTVLSRVVPAPATRPASPAAK